MRPAVCKVIGEEDWISDEAFLTPEARLLHLGPIFRRIEQWTMTKTKRQAMEVLNRHDIPCGPILSMQEIAEEPSLRASGTIVEVEHPTRGRNLKVGNPIKMSDSPTHVTRSPLLGEHNRGDRGAACRAGHLTHSVTPRVSRQNRSRRCGRTSPRCTDSGE